MDSWFFLSFPFPAELLSEIAGPEGAKNLAGKIFRRFQIRLAVSSLEKITSPCQDKKAAITNHRFKFHKCHQLFIRMHNETLSIGAMCAYNECRSPA
jgi:hypothetical protein